MTQAAAYDAARDLKAAMNRWGVVCSIELQSGRGSDPWGVYTKYLRMWHHTASWYRVGGSLTPLLWLVKAGREADNLPGPLCNGYIGYDRVFRIICMGEANHPGTGGPVTIDGVTIPANSARKPTFGIEVEGGYQSWEEIDRLGPDMLEVMGRSDCALAEWSGRPLTSQLEHKTWAPTRKVDRKDFDGARVRGIALTRKWFDLANPTPDPVTPPIPEGKDDMFAYTLTHTNGSTYLVLVSGGKQVRVNGASIGDHIRAQDYYIGGPVDSHFAGWLRTAYGAVIGLA